MNPDRFRSPVPSPPLVVPPTRVIQLGDWKKIRALKIVCSSTSGRSGSRGGFSRGWRYPMITEAREVAEGIGAARDVDSAGRRVPPRTE